MKNKLLFTAIVFVLVPGLLSISGCMELGNALGMKSPSASYRDFEVKNLSLEQIGFDLDFDLENPNSFDIPVATLDWNLDLFGEAFSFGKILFEDAEPGADALAPEGAVLTYLGIEHIPANGALSLRTPFNVALLDTFEGIVRVVQGEDVPFTIGGTIHFKSQFGEWDLPFSQSGIWSNEDVVAVVEGAGAAILADILF